MNLDIKDIIRKYFNRNKKYLYSKKILHQMNGSVLLNTSNVIFDFYGIMLDEVANYCKEQGYSPDKIIFLSSYDIMVERGESVNISMGSNSKISIIKENDIIIAIVFMGESVEVKRGIYV